MPLEEYAAKRRLEYTPELAPGAAGGRFPANSSTATSKTPSPRAITARAA